MKQQRKAVGELRNLLNDMQPRVAKSPESEAWRAFQYHNANQAYPQLEQTPRALMRRTIDRIAGRFAWGPETVQHFLDKRGQGAVYELSDPQLEDLHGQMLAYEDSAMTGCSSPDEPPAS